MGKPTVAELNKDFQDLYNQLNDGYWSATSIDAKDRIRGISEIVYDILIDINRADLTSRTPEYVELEKAVEYVNKRLDKLKEEIDSIIKKLKLAGQIVNGIDKALDTAAKFFVA